MIGRSYKGVCNYLHAKIENGIGEVLECRGVRTERSGMIADFNSGRLYNEKLSRCVWHAALSFSPEDKLVDEKMLEIAKQWMTKMDLHDTQWAIIKHTDTVHPHLHIVASRIADDGRTINDSNNYKRSQAICRELEKKYNLTPVPEIRQEEKINHEKLRSRDKIKSEIHLALQQVLTKSNSIGEFNLLMKERKIECLWKYNPDGSPRGLSFEKEGVKIKASDINRIYSARHLQFYFERKQHRVQGQANNAVKSSINDLAYAAKTFAEINDSKDYDEGVIRLDKFLKTKQIKYGRKF